MGEILKILRGLESTHPFSLLILDSSSEPRIKTTRDFLNSQFADLLLSPKHHQSGSQTQVEVYLRDMKRNKTLNLPTKNPIHWKHDVILLGNQHFFWEESFNLEIFSSDFLDFLSLWVSARIQRIESRHRWSLTAAGASWPSSVFHHFHRDFHRDFLHFNGLGSSKQLLLCVSWRWDSGVKHANVDAI